MAVLYFDGACSGNPGVGGWGYTLKDGEKEYAGCGGEKYTTNNQMEYTALIKGMEKAISVGVKRLIVRGDSLLVIKQITGEFRVKDPKLISLWEVVKRLESQFEEVCYEWVPREGNSEADRLAQRGKKVAEVMP